MSETLAEYLKSQDELMREAALALPHQFSQCTYSLGPLRYPTLISDLTIQPHQDDPDKRCIFALLAQRRVGCALRVLWLVTQNMNKLNCEYWLSLQWIHIIRY